MSISGGATGIASTSFCGLRMRVARSAAGTVAAFWWSNGLQNFGYEDRRPGTSFEFPISCPKSGWVIHVDLVMSALSPLSP
jgi:hypothetical protein